MTKNYGDYFNIAHIEPESHIYGPGKRFVIWLQGCSLACEGCWNKEMWSFESKQLIHRQQLLDVIFGNKIISGITLLGGEPLHQAKNIWWLLEQIRLHSHLTIFLFTGYEMNELEKFGFQARIESLCDIVAIGRYDNNQRNIRQQWIGSDNQSVFYPKNSREYNKPIPCNQAELIISHDGKVTILGFPDDGLISALNL